MTSEELKKKAPRAFGFVLRWLLFLALVTAAFLVVVDEIKPGAAGAAIGVLVVAVLIAVLTPNDIRDIARRVESLKVAGMELIVRDAEKAASGAAGSEENERATESTDLLTLRLRLEAKLTYLAKHFFGDFVTIGSLEYDKLLTAEQGRTATRVMTWTDGYLQTLPAESRGAFLNDAATLVRNVRAAVLEGQVRKRLEKADWSVEKLPEGRRDLLVTKEGQGSVRVVPLWAVTRESDLPEKTAKRLKKTKGKEPLADKRIIVLPPNASNDLLTGSDSDPRVVKDSDELPAQVTADR